MAPWFPRRAAFQLQLLSLNNKYLRCGGLAHRPSLHPHSGFPTRSADVAGEGGGDKLSSHLRVFSFFVAMMTGRDARNSLNGIHVRAPERSKRQQPTYRCRTCVIICGLFPRIVNLALVGAEEQNPWRNLSLDRFPILGCTCTWHG